jgi:predicted RNase H-like HicB family nuclease
MNPTYTALIQQDDDWWIGWVEEIPGVNSQGRTREELMENLQYALQETLEMNRAEALSAVKGDFEETRIQT